LANTYSYVDGRIRVQQEKISRAEHTWTNPLIALQEAILYSFIKFCTYCFSLWHEFFVHCALTVEKIISVILMRDIWNFSFFGPRNVSPTHSERLTNTFRTSHQPIQNVSPTHSERLTNPFRMCHQPIQNVLPTHSECLTNPIRTLSLCFGVIGKTPDLISRNNFV
jgi:hypothetical protein